LLKHGSVVVLEIAKRIANRTRPDLSDNLSFPSGHSAIAFTMLLYCTSSTKTLIFGTLVGFYLLVQLSFRLANNKHFASDVLAGAGIGMASGIISRI
jgi:membrane-associated phospholipid phosphatase